MKPYPNFNARIERARHAYHEDPFAAAREMAIEDLDELRRGWFTRKYSRQLAEIHRQFGEPPDRPAAPAARETTNTTTTRSTTP